MTTAVRTARAGSQFWKGFWRLADPKISLTSIASIYLAAGATSLVQPVHLWWLLLTGLVIVALEASKNATGDIFDYDSGTDLRVAAEDKTDFSGGKRVLVEGLLTRRQTWGIAVAAGVLGAVLGLAIVVWREPAALWFGLVGGLLAWSYHGPPLKLAYRGAGELAVLLVYGPLVALCTFVIQTHAFEPWVIWLSLPLGLQIAAFLWVNEFPDYAADKASGKRNLVVRLGKRRAALALAPIYGAAAAVVAALPALGLPMAAWWGGLFVLPAAYASWAVLRDPETFYRHKPVQPAALAAFLLYAVGAGTGLLFA
jgi:1,4-dihydroxy-2-naphthoate octaprenyltransferase